MKQYCECCSQLKNDVKWREETEQFECEECYNLYLDYDYDYYVEKG